MYLLALLMGQILIAYSQEPKMIAIYFQLLTDFRIVKVMKHESDGELRKMRILWVSGRVIDKDLCRTTQIALASGLTSIGHEVTLASPGYTSDEFNFNHISLQRSRIKGFQSKSIANSVRQIKPDYDIIMVDWRLAPFLQTWLNQSQLPWYLVDRGPPANSGILSSIQWRYWKRAWKMADRGMSVSNIHADFIREKTGTNAKIDALNAGAETGDYYSSTLNKDRPRFIYIGKVDANRDVDKLPEMVLKAGGSLKIIGSGDIFKKMDKKWKSHKDVKIVGSVSNKQVKSFLNDSDIGLLPMPDRTVWRLASPLKLAEYASAGLLVAGIEHSGNDTTFNAEWLFLAPTLEEAIVRAMNEIENNELSETARRDAIKYFDWSISTGKLEEILHAVITLDD